MPPRRCAAPQPTEPAAGTCAAAAVQPQFPLGDDEFPDEALALVCRFLGIRQLGRLACVARRFTEPTLTEPGSGARISAIEEGARLQTEAATVCDGVGGGATTKRAGETWVRVLWRTQYRLTFHEICGPNARLYNDNASSFRTKSFADAICGSRLTEQQSRRS